MKAFTLPLLVLALIGLTLNVASAEDKKQRKNDATAQIKKRLAAAELPADVLEKCNKIVAEQGQKLSQAQAKVDAVLTAEQKQAQATAQKAAKEAGKKKEFQAEVAAAAKLTDEQKTKLAAAQKDLATAQAELQTALKGALTAEQQQKVIGKVKKKQA